ncbi:MAG TPA: non-ribosomal peptide synthetase, partial [Burkholderiaceae bacterium]|nr:non-ribosomal peptide synthetase [Burkholderiaceae bacterium]
ESFEALLGDAAADVRARCGELNLLSLRQQQLLGQWNATSAPFERESTVADWVERSIRAHRDRVAVRCNGESLTYAQLGARVERLALRLRERGAQRGRLIGLLLPRGTAMLTAMLAVMRSGSAYVALDPAYPPARLRYVIEDANLAVVVVQRAGEPIDAIVPDGIEVLDVEDEAAVVVPAIGADRDAQPPAPAGPDDPAYVSYTSGSTGQPKGVVVPHRAVVNFLQSMQRQPGLTPQDRLVAVTSLSFDISVLELLLPLVVGARVAIADRATVQDGRALASLLRSEQATVMQATPAGWRLLLAAGWSPPPGFKALVGGEPLSLDLARQLLQRAGELWNLYGPTETTVWSTAWRVDADRPVMSIGTPIANTRIHVLDERLQPCPIGVAGEIFVGGDGVAHGYLGRPELTAQRFVAEPTRPAARMYRTGDRGRWASDGLLEHLGRNDLQIKVNGHRIEPGEIEAAANRLPSVLQTVAIARTFGPDDLRLVLYVVAAGDDLDPLGVRRQLQQTLPAYMVPQHVVRVTAIPTLPNGKTNFAALPSAIDEPLDRGRAAADEPRGAAARPLSPIEQSIAQIWAARLGVAAIRPDDNFFDLGGTSLLAMQVIVDLEKQLGLRVTPERMAFETLSQLAGEAAPAAASAPSHRPRTLLRFGRSGRELVGVLHRPAASQPHRPAAVLCNPWGQEAVQAHRA